MRCLIIGGLVVLSVLGLAERPSLEDIGNAAAVRNEVDVAAVNRVVRHFRRDTQDAEFAPPTELAVTRRAVSRDGCP